MQSENLDELRTQLQEIDKQLLSVIRDRLVLCSRIGEFKRNNKVPMMQPQRIQIVHDRAAAFAKGNGINPIFLRRLYDLIIEETCRLEDEIMSGKDSCRNPMALALRIDHLAIAVCDLETAIAMLADKYGFELVEKRNVEGEFSGMYSATMRAGGVTLVLCQGDSSKSNVSKYIDNYGPGVQHIAIEVRDLNGVHEDIKLRGADLLTDVIHGSGLDQSFTRRDRNSGIQFEFISRSTSSGFQDANVKELFKAMERENVF